MVRKNSSSPTVAADATDAPAATDDAVAELDLQAWAARIAAAANLPDDRLNQRLAVILADVAGNAGCSIPHASADPHQAKAFYRFLDNKRVKPVRIADAAAVETVRSCEGEKVVYVVQDTTSFNYTNLTTAVGLGPINDSETARGIHLHSTLALDADGVVRGPIDLKIWARPVGKRTAHERFQRPIEEKESSKWLDGVRAARKAFDALPADQRPRLIHVMDAEGDVHEVLDLIAASGDGCIIRVAQNRCVAGQDDFAFDAVRRTPLLGLHQVKLAARDGKPERTAEVEVRVARLTLTSNKRKHPERRPIELSLIEAYEPAPPEGAEGICWRLWVVEPVATFADAVAFLRGYGNRWKSEDYHYTLKSGCGVEKLQLETADRLMNAIALYATAAARLVGLRDLARRRPEAPCTLVLKADEWKPLAARFGAPTDGDPPTIKQATLWIGRLGGHHPSKRTPMPGVKTLWRGWRDLQLIAAGYRLHRASAPAAGCRLHRGSAAAAGCAASLAGASTKPSDT